MRSIVALAMAALVLAAHAPGLFTETPVCAAVDGVQVVAGRGSASSNAFFLWKKKKAPPSPSCCGTAACPMHTHGCGQTAACTMDAVYGPQPMVASVEPERAGSNDMKLCAPSCGREGVKMTPGQTDPGTLELNGQPTPLLARSGCSHRSRAPSASRSSDPAVPPPRS